MNFPKLFESRPVRPAEERMDPLNPSASRLQSKIRPIGRFYPPKPLQSKQGFSAPNQWGLQAYNVLELLRLPPPENLRVLHNSGPLFPAILETLLPFRLANQPLLMCLRLRIHPGWHGQSEQNFEIITSTFQYVQPACPTSRER